METLYKNLVTTYQDNMYMLNQLVHPKETFLDQLHCIFLADMDLIESAPEKKYYKGLTKALFWSVCSMFVALLLLVVMHIEITHPVVQKACVEQEIPYQTKEKEKSVRYLNSLDKKGLDEIDGVGPAIAERILKDRAMKGDFSFIEDIYLVYGIGEKKGQQIIQHVLEKTKED